MNMKFIKNIFLFVLVATLAACETDIDTPQIYTPENFVAPVIGDCNDVIVTADNGDETVIFTWKAADFGLPVQVLYSVYLSYGENTALLGTSSSLYYSVTKSDLSGFIINSLKAVANEKVNVTAYVTAQMSGTTNYEPVKSQVSDAFSVTTHAIPATNIYVVGYFTNWLATSNDCVEIWETAGGSYTFKGLYDFIDDPNNPGTSGFKIVTERGWSGGNWGYDAFTVGNDITSSSDGNLVVSPGYWWVSVNTTVMSIEVESVKSVGIMGTFNSWGSEEPLTYDVKQNVWASQPVAFDANGEFLVRLNGNYDGNNKFGSSGKNSSTFENGVELVTGGGDNIKVAEAGTYIVKFYADRTPCVVVLEKQ